MYTLNYLIYIQLNLAKYISGC